MTQSEVLDLVNSLSCQNMAPFPKPTSGAIGGLVEGVPLICGGEDSDWDARDECYQVTKAMTSFVTKMKSKRDKAASVVLENKKLWIMGGKDDNSKLSSSEYIQISSGSTSGPDLPFAVWFHSVVAWNSSSFMLMGGQAASYNFVTKTFYYHESNPEWIPGPEVKLARWYQASGLGVDQATNVPCIALTGGAASGDVWWDSVELLYEGETEWQAGKD